LIYQIIFLTVFEGFQAM